MPNDDPPKLNHLAPPWFHAAWEELREWLIEHRPVQGTGITITDNKGKIISAIAGAGNSATASHPFKVTTTSEDDAVMAVVEIDSWLSLSPRLADKMTITGLGSPFEIALGHVIWLEVTFTAGVPSSATIRCEPWDGDEDKPYVVDSLSAPNYLQEEARHVIAEIVAADPTYPNRLKLTIGEDECEINQCCTTNLMLCQTCVDALTLMIIAPASAPALSIAPV